MNLAWIGLGAIGTPMALNLLKAGYGLTVHNRTPSRCAALEAAGAEVAPSPAAAARQADALLLCVSDDAAAEAVLLGGPDPAVRTQAAVAGLRPGSLVIDCSTISPATSRRLAITLDERQIRYIDAPVTGGTEGAKAGTLSLLVGGDSHDLERARPLLEVIGGRITHFGPVGSGQEAKAVNQVLVAGSYAAVAEALQLAERLGLDRHQVVEALKGGAAGSWALEHRSAQMINDHYPLGFKLALHRKDLGIALEAAAAQQLELPVTEQVAAMEDALLTSGHGDLDVSALARWFRS
ncbi:NAD(P)-dependent oxidoreductase [Vulcanococcus sp. Clear-D1]|uniref:NAD(P)-dependent oxidoreductase n=1 Tax=Vulcanococcus sp. Clear-D1 TaxID=2766970 RepID=UPI0019A57237|nr:NAD(P)-dependent oxidoreductase [Vulcanococcus sp. Clear-D1]MBD1195503.1 NAD(P)-dependent oxidoreductase [Vulcanococcus sp. Clear-D1]